MSPVAQWVRDCEKLLCRNNIARRKSNKNSTSTQATVAAPNQKVCAQRKLSCNLAGLLPWQKYEQKIPFDALLLRKPEDKTRTRATQARTFLPKLTLQGV